MKVLYINSCGECPYCDLYLKYCRVFDSYIYTDIGLEIPDWCNLEDSYEEEEF